MKKRAAPKDREYLESLNLKAIQKGSKPTSGQDKREFYQELQTQAKDGPLFAPKTLSLVDRLPELPKPVTKWLGVLATNSAELAKVNPGDLVDIIRWVRESKGGGAQIAKMSWDVAVDAADDFASHGDTARGKFQQNAVAYRFKDGWTVVALETEHDITLEGKLVQNCLRDPSHEWFEKVSSGNIILYSLRTPANSPRVDIEVNANGQVEQCFGKQNQPPMEKYNKYLIEFFEHQGLLDGIRHLVGVSDMSSDLWTKIAQHENVAVRRSAAENPDTPVDILDMLSTDGSVDVRRMVAKNPSTPVAVVAELARDRDHRVRMIAAQNTSLPDTSLALLAKDRSSDVRYFVARNPATTSQTLATLAGDIEFDVRKAVASNPSTPTDTLEALAQDSTRTVKCYVARNPSTPTDVLKTLAQDLDKDVRGDAIHYLKSRGITLAAVKDREYLQSLNLKALQKTTKPAPDQDKREFYQELQEEAKSGPLFDQQVLTMVKDLPELPKHVTKWLANLSKGGLAHIDPRGLNLIIDWARGDSESTKIQNMTWDQAVAAQQAWHESNFEVQETGDYTTKDVVQDFGGGWTMVKIDNEQDLDTEGNLMGHCVGGDDYWQAVQNGHSSIYSLRDPQNQPHVTIEVDNDTNEVSQCLGKQNRTPVKKYNKYLFAFFHKHKLMDGILHLEDSSGVPDSMWMDLLKAKPRLIGRIAYNDATPPSVLDHIARLQNTDSLITRWLERNKNTSAETLAYIATNHKHADYSWIIQNPNVSEDLLWELAKSDDADDLQILMKSKYVTPTILEHVAKCDFAWIRTMVASHPNVTLDTLKVLAGDKNSGVVEAVAANPLATVQMLDTMSKHQSSYVRANVAENENTRVTTLDQLAEDPESDVRYRVCTNPNTSAYALKKLTNDTVGHVAARANHALREHPDYLEEELSIEEGVDYLEEELES